MGHDFDLWLGIRNWKIEAMERQVWREEEEEQQQQQQEQEQDQEEQEEEEKENVIMEMRL